MGQYNYLDYNNLKAHEKSLSFRKKCRLRAMTVVQHYVHPIHFFVSKPFKSFRDVSVPINGRRRFVHRINRTIIGIKSLVLNPTL